MGDWNTDYTLVEACKDRDWVKANQVLDMFEVAHIVNIHQEIYPTEWLNTAIKYPTGELSQAALFYAAFDGELELVKKLIDAGANSEGRLDNEDEETSGPTAIMAAVAGMNLVGDASDGVALARVDGHPGGRSTTQDMVSVEKFKRYKDIIQVLKDGGANINSLNGSYKTVLAQAFLRVEKERPRKEGNVKMINYLLEQGASLDIPSNTYWNNELEKFAINGYDDLVKILVDNGAYGEVLNDKHDSVIEKVMVATRARKIKPVAHPWAPSLPETWPSMLPLVLSKESLADAAAARRADDTIIDLLNKGKTFYNAQCPYGYPVCNSEWHSGYCADLKEMGDGVKIPIPHDLKQVEDANASCLDNQMYTQEMKRVSTNRPNPPHSEAPAWRQRRETLGTWLNEAVEHKGTTIGSIHKDFADILTTAAGGDVPIGDFAEKVSAEKLVEVIAASGKKKPMIQKLYKRLHYELGYPLTAEQSKLVVQTLGMWLNEAVEHKGRTIGSIHKDFADILTTAAGGDVPIGDFAEKVSAEKLVEVIAASGKKKPMIQKLYKRLHYELGYPLTAEQSKLAGVVRVDDVVNDPEFDWISVAQSQKDQRTKPTLTLEEKRNKLIKEEGVWGGARRLTRRKKNKKKTHKRKMKKTHKKY